MPVDQTCQPHAWVRHSCSASSRALSSAASPALSARISSRRLTTDSRSPVRAAASRSVAVCNRSTASWHTHSSWTKRSAAVRSSDSRRIQSARSASLSTVSSFTPCRRHVSVSSDLVSCSTVAASLARVSSARHLCPRALVVSSLQFSYTRAA